MANYWWYILTILWPMIIIGFGNMVNESKVTSLLAYMNFVALSTYYFYYGMIEGWFLALSYVLLSVVIVFMYRSLYTIGGS